MASSSGTSSVSSLIQNSGSEEDLQNLMDERKRKRMISNRESAKRSRMRKQKHLDDLVVQVAQLMREKSQIISGMSVTTQHFLKVEEENTILRAQVSELSHRLESLNGIVNCFLNANNNNNFSFGNEELYTIYESNDGLMNNNQWNDLYLNQPIITSADMLQC